MAETAHRHLHEPAGVWTGFTCVWLLFTPPYNRWCLAPLRACTCTHVRAGSAGLEIIYQAVWSSSVLQACGMLWNLHRRFPSLHHKQSYQTAERSHLWNQTFSFSFFFFPCADWDQFTISLAGAAVRKPNVCAVTFNFGFFHFKIWTRDLGIRCGSASVVFVCVRKAFSLRASVPIDIIFSLMSPRTHICWRERAWKYKKEFMAISNRCQHVRS